MASVPTYRGSFGKKQAERLLWRAGFGPKPGEAKKLARMSLNDAVHSLTRPGKEHLTGPRPRDGDGNPIAPYDAYGHDALWFIDRMVRTNTPHMQRMALVWHDWFATGDVGSQRFSIEQVKMFRDHALGRFDSLVREVTKDRAMLLWLNGIDNEKDAPNENYGREMMELFTLGVSDDTGYPYSEDDVREQARALTGWTADYVDNVGFTNFRYSDRRHDKGSKTIFGHTGKYDWKDSVRLCLAHDAHAPYFINRLWKYFIAVDPPAADAVALEQKYVDGGYSVQPVVEAILKHPLLYDGPSLVKPPLVQIAGMLRSQGKGILTDSWTWLTDLAGQRPFRPPNVAGWDETRWLDTSTFRGRWASANAILGHRHANTNGKYSETETADEALDKALDYWGHPSLTPITRQKLLEFGAAVETAATADWEQSAYRGIRQNALRLLIATSPDYEAC